MMGGKWEFGIFLPPIFGDPGGQITGFLPPIIEDPGGQIFAFAPHHGGQINPPEAENFEISNISKPNSLWENVFIDINFGSECLKKFACGGVIFQNFLNFSQKFAPHISGPWGANFFLPPIFRNPGGQMKKRFAPHVGGKMYPPVWTHPGRFITRSG